MAKEFLGTRERLRGKIGSEPDRDPHRGQPRPGRDRHDRAGAAGIRELPSDEEPHQECERPADGRERVRDQQVVAGHQSGDDG